MDAFLVVNAGSSSIKFNVYVVGAGDALFVMSRGQLDGIGTRPRLRAHDDRGAGLIDKSFTTEEVPDLEAATARVGAWLRERYADARLVAVGHRVAHGGPVYAAPVAVDDTVVKELEQFIPLAPLHQPHQLRPMRTLAARFPGILQVACFDTADVADRYAIPTDEERMIARHTLAVWRALNGPRG
jgi:acetate kinase